MRLSRLYIRFFRSFNFDYERKADRKAKPLEWEMIDGAWYPFVRVDLDPAVTAIVGANESGKSHLIDALRFALLGEGIDHRDFCRYSTLFSVEKGHVRKPDFGLELTLDEEDTEAFTNADESLVLLRMDAGNFTVEPSGDLRPLEADQLKALENLLPVPFTLATDVPLPDSISFDVLQGRPPGPLSRRRTRFKLLDTFREQAELTSEVIAGLAPALAGALDGAVSDTSGEAAGELTPEQLARSLLLDVANIDPARFADLENALRDDREGLASGLVERMNEALALHLNFSRWWRQDADFELRLQLRDQDLAFTIRDRTGSEYSYSERSRGLKFFLSYFVQLMAHKRTGDHAEVLLMDEPDAFLSSAGQQDLLRRLEHFADPEGGNTRDQVVYVTHSPFLINKNAAHRIRVLDKGSDEEGTRVVRDVARNHYEPLRSSLGSFVAETAFIGGANLFVEGVADQVLLAGINALLRHRGIAPTKLLDLNDVTIVPAGSASSVPYMAYLARGRDEIKPPGVALLDGDDAGRDAQRKLARAAVNKRPVLAQEYVIDVGEWAADNSLDVDRGVTVREIEDLIPAHVTVAAAQRYAIRLLGTPESEAEGLKPKPILDKLTDTDGSLWKALEKIFAATFGDAHIDKIGFAKELIYFTEAHADDARRPPGMAALEKNFGKLIAHLAARLHDANRTEADERRSRRLKRTVRGFARDFADGASKDSADQALRDVEGVLGETPADDEVRNAISALRRDFELTSDPLDPVADYADFLERLKRLRYVPRLSYQESSTSS